MNHASSPSITALPSGGTEIAYEDNTNTLSVVGPAGQGSLGLSMWHGSSPSITSLPVVADCTTCAKKVPGTQAKPAAPGTARGSSPVRARPVAWSRAQP
jgi:hypothetical protein